MYREQLRLLIIEDERATLEAYELLLNKKCHLTFASTCTQALRQWKATEYDIVLLDLNLPDGNGHDLLKTIRQSKPNQDVIIASAQSQAHTIVESIKLGAFDYITKPIDKEVLFRALKKIENAKRVEWERSVLLQKVQDSFDQYHGIVGQSISMRHISEIVFKLKGTQTSILLLGESGVGKEVITRAIHRQEENPLRPFVAVNCAAIPENLLESELFGHEKGAFTGATQARPGKFLQANGGDIFLDEIACMSPTLQAKLLRILQDKMIEPLGGARQIRSNFRVIAATNQDLQSMIDKGTFRKDLYFRLQGVEIYIPPLRARPEDVPALIEYILKDLLPKFGRRHFTQEALHVMMKYDWPGNVRELKNTVENILILSPDEVIDEMHLPPNLTCVKEGGPQNLMTHFRSNIKNHEKDIIVAALKRYRGNKSRACKELGISRSILYRKMKMLNLQEKDIF